MFHKSKDMRKPLQLVFIPPFIPFFKAREFFTLPFYKFLIGRKKIFQRRLRRISTMASWATVARARSSSKFIQSPVVKGLRGARQARAGC